MTWNPPTNVSTGNALTALLWNNQLGASGSLQYVYNELNTTQLKRHIVLYKSTNTVFAGAGNADIAFDTIINNYTEQQLNFPVTVPITNIPLPADGMYVATFQSRTTVNTQLRCNFTVTTGGVTYFYADFEATLLNVLQNHIVMFYATASSTVKLNLAVNLATTISAIAPSATDGSQLLTIARI